MGFAGNTAWWDQFRRLRLGTVVEALLESGLAVEFSTLRISFGPDSAFQVPRLDNYMRFVGVLEARLGAAPPPGAVEAARARLVQAWPALLSVVDLPVGDRLTSERNHLTVRVDAGPTGAVLRVEFDLEAD